MGNSINIDNVLGSIDLSRATRFLMDDYFSRDDGSEYKYGFFLFAETAGKDYFEDFFNGKMEAAQDLNGQVYSAEKLKKMGYPVPISCEGVTMNGEELYGLLFSMNKCVKGTRKGKVPNSRLGRYIKLLKQKPETNTGQAPKTGTYTELNPRGEGRQTTGMRPFRTKREQVLSIDQIWGQFHKTRDDYFRNLLMEHYRSLVRYCAERLHSKLPDMVELDDLIGAGIFGLMDGIDAFDPERGVKFETYCSPRIRGSILDEMRSMDWVPRLVRARAHQLARATHSLEIHLGRKPSEKEIAKKLDMDMKEFGRLQRDAKAGSLVSLDTRYNDGNSEKDIREIDTIKDPHAETPLAEFQKKSLKELLTKGLTRGERLVVVLYYYENMTMKEIGETLDLSESRVSQMHSSIIARLKAQMHGKMEEYFMTR